MNDIKKYYLMRVIVSVIFGAAFGVFLLLLAPFGTELFDVLVIAIGLFTLLVNFPHFVSACLHIKRKGEWITLLLSLSSGLVGVGFMLLTGEFLPWLFLAYSLVLPVVRIVLVSSKKRQIKRELVHPVIGVFMMLVFYSNSQSYVLRYGGIAVLVLTGLYLILGVLYTRFLKNE